MVGFIYIDEQAGFTYNYESRFIMTNNGLEKLPSALDSVSFKVRLSQNTANVAVLSDEEVKQLNLPEVPDWLKYYKENENENSYLVRIGFLYNSVGASHNAIEPLLKVYEKEPHFQGLEFELAYAYNATKQFDKAIPVINKAIENDPKNFWFYRELGFALKNQNKLADAEKVYLEGIKLSSDKSQKAEMAVNMAQSYFQVKDKAKFKEWAKLTKKYADKKTRIYEYIDYFEKNWDK
jgi:predicted Zn-dependent protease